MAVYEYEGDFVPSALLQQVRAAGITCFGITCTQDATGVVTAVQVVVDDDLDKAALDSAVAAYTPPPQPPDVATAGDHESASAAIVSEKLAAIPITREQLPLILEGLLGEATSAIPYYENYTLTPDPTTAWTNFQALDQTSKDRILYNCCRSLAAIMRYLSGDLQPTA